MESKDDPVWFAKQLVETLQREVAQKEAELALLVSHRASLLLAFSTPTFPLGYTPPGSVSAEDASRLYHLSKTSPGLIPDEPGPSGRHSRLKTARSPAVKQTSPSSPRRSSQHPPDTRSQGSGSGTETSDDSHHTQRTTRNHERNQPTIQEVVVLDAGARHVPSRSCDSGESSETSEGYLQPSPVTKFSRNQPNFPVVNWTQQIKKRTTSGNGDSSTDTGDSISSDASADEDLSKSVKVTNPRKTSTSVPRTAKVTAQAQTLSSDAPPEEKFDWEVLGILGPWSPDHSSSLLANSSWSQLQKQQSPLPCKFQTINEYKCSFEGLILEECKAHLNSSWDIHKAPVAGPDQNVAEILGIPDDRSQSSLWQFRPMYPSSDDPFKYVEAEQIEGLNIRLDQSEVVLLTHNDTKFLAVVTLTNYKGVLLRTRMELPAAGGQCALLRMVNMVTLKRQYVALCRATEIWDPLQQQLLNPLEGSNFVISAISDSYQEEDVKAGSSIRASSWRKEKLFNKKQLGIVEALLRLQQGFLLVQGPPGTGKTSTIVGIISAVRIEEPRARILVCASSNAAVDEIVSRMMHHMHNLDGKSYTPKRGTLVRLGVEKSIQTTCLAVSLDKFVQGNSSASNNSTIRRETIAGAFIVCCTISGSGHQVFDEVNQKFDLLIIVADACYLLFVDICAAAAIVVFFIIELSADEAAQAQESEVLIALQRVKGRCVMVGDPCQLPAVVIQRPGKAYGRSLFERMQEAGRPVLMMTTQYRMNPLISKFPSATFYEGRLKDSSQSHSMLPIFKENIEEKSIDILGYSFKLGAYFFLDVTWGVEQGELVGHSISNIDEAEVVATVVQGVVRSLKAGVVPNIGVITPYLAQRSMIMRNLEKYGVDENACEVNTVDGFQGREKDVIILSCVRAQAEHGLGFVSDVRRMNVALTRARHSLIIVGHADTLRRQCPAWNALVEDATARGLYEILYHCSKITKMETSVKDACGRQANVPYGRSPHATQRRFEQGPTTVRTDAGHLPSHKRFEEETHSPSGILQRPSHTWSEQGATFVSATGRDVDQSKFVSLSSTATEGGQLAIHTRFEDEVRVNIGNLKPSNLVSSEQPLSVICGMASNLSMGDRSTKRGFLKRKADQGGSPTRHDEAEGSNSKRGRPLKVKIEDLEGHCTRSPGPEVSFLAQPELPGYLTPAVVPQAPIRRQMRGQISNDWKGSGRDDTRSRETTPVKEEMQEEIPRRQYPQHTREDQEIEAVVYDRDDNSTMEFSNERRGSFPRGKSRGRGRGRHRGSGNPNCRPIRTEDVLGREQNGSRQRISPVRPKPSRGWHRGRGKFSRPHTR